MEQCPNKEALRKWTMSLLLLCYVKDEEMGHILEAEN